MNVPSPKKSSFLLFAMVAFFAFAGSVTAQNSSGTILGAVSDTAGARVPGTTIIVTNVDTDSVVTLTTDTRGAYTAPILPIGRYRVEARHEGFSTTIIGPITLTVGQQAVVDVSLTVGAVTQTVTVNENVPQVDTADSSLRWLVGQDQMQNLPLNGRNFVQLTLLTPGIQPVPQENSEGGTALVPFGFGNPQRFSVAGGRPQGQLFLLDGTDTAGVWGNGTGVNMAGTSLGVDAIAEFAALTDTYSANFGGNGGVINAVFRSGTNQLHGSAYEFARNSALDASEHFKQAGTGTLPFSRNQFGGTLGGPLRKDKTFFFANYEELNQNFCKLLSQRSPARPFARAFFPARRPFTT